MTTKKIYLLLTTALIGCAPLLAFYLWIHNVAGICLVLAMVLGICGQHLLTKAQTVPHRRTFLRVGTTINLMGMVLALVSIVLTFNR